MPDTPQTEDAREADDMGEKPDLGRTPDAMIEQLTGTDSGSDTRAGSLRGGSVSGSDDEPDQDVINESLASEGMSMAAQAQAQAQARPSADPQSPSSVGPGAIKNTGVAPGEADENPAEGKREADAATG